MNQSAKIVLLILIFNFAGCNPKNCDSVQKYFDIESLDITPKKISETYSDGSFSTQAFDVNNTVNFNDLVLEIKPMVSYYGQNNSFNLGNLFVNSAYAGKCPPSGHNGSVEQISDIIILSNNPFLSSGTSSDTLSHFFSISGRDHKSGKIELTDLPSFTSTQPNVMTEINLMLKVKPTGSNEHEFTIIYKQTNGEIYALTTPTIKFN